MSTESLPDDMPGRQAAPPASNIDPTLIAANLAEELSIAGNVSRYIQNMVSTIGTDGRMETVLRDQQLPVFSDLARFMAGPAERGHVILPTGSGKTALQAETANAICYGTQPGQPDRPKILVLVPKKDLLYQGVGWHDDDDNPIGGFARFAPGLSTSIVGDGKHDLSGDVVFASYDSLRNMVKAGKPIPNFDAVMCDEAHRSLGKVTRQAVDIVTENCKTIAFTASPDFDDVKSVRRVYPEKIHEISLRKAIEIGMLSKLQVWTYKTDVKLTVPVRSGEFTDQELQKLLAHEGRNQAAVRIAKNYVEQGLQGVIACLPGQETQHAIDMAARLSDTDIIDKDGVARKMIAATVSGAMDPKERQKIYKKYKEGHIDVLTYVDLLTEGWDAPNAKFLINLRPTKSPVNAIQRLGRVLRLYGDSTAQIVEFLDEFEGAEAHTAYHVLGDLEAPLNNGHVYGETRQIVDSSRDPRQLPDMAAIADLIESCHFEILNELYLGPAEREKQREIKTGKLLTVAQAVGEVAIRGGSISAEALLSAIMGAVVVEGLTYIYTDELEQVMPRYIEQKEDISADKAISLVAARLQREFGPDAARSASAIETKLRALTEASREFKAADARNVSIRWNSTELHNALDTLLAPYDAADFQSLYDYYHDNNGVKVRFLRHWYDQSNKVAQRKLAEQLIALQPEERLRVLRLGVNPFNAVDIMYHKALLEPLSGLRARYLAAPDRS